MLQGSPSTPVAGLPPAPATADPQAHDKDNTDILDGLLRDLNEVRARISALMAEDFPEMRKGVFERPPLTVKELDRRDENVKLRERERQLMSMIREQRGGL
jgi:hypothetical protein